MKRIFLLIIFCFGLSLSVYAKELESNFFHVQFYESVSLQNIYEELLSVPDSVQIAAIEAKEGISSKFLQRLDNLYYVVSDIMDIHLDQVTINIFLVKSKQEISELLESTTGEEIKAASFYNKENNTIYISEEEFRVGVLGHELGHAIIAHYFVVPPPEKMQEVLCGYVEYSLLKNNLK